MKLENELVVAVQTSLRKSYNPFDSDEEDTDVKNNINGYDIKSFETTPDSLTFHLDNNNLSWEEAIIGHSRLLSNPNSVDASNEEVLYRKDSELFTDKTVTECELPELFSYKDNGFHPVKDIGIDEGVPTHDKAWIKSLDNHDSKNMSTVVAFNDSVNGDVLFPNDVEKGPFVQDTTEELVKESGVVHEALERPNLADKHGTDNMLMADEFAHNSSKKQSEAKFVLHTEELVRSGDVVNGKKDQVDEKDKVDRQKVMTDNEVHGEHCKDNVSLENVEPSGIHVVEAFMESKEAQHAEKSSTQPSIAHEAEATTKSNDVHVEISPKQPSVKHEVEATLESNESQNEEAPSVQLVENPAYEELDDKVNNSAMSYNSKVEPGSIILDFNAEAATSTSSEKEEEDISQKNEAVEVPPAAQSMSRDDDAVSLPGCSILECATDRRVHGETSFSAAMPPLSSITYMGPVAHSGNISLRSESSAGSTRSFAFPVLQAEWNTSPVRMAKADQKNLRKHKGWFMCCKF